MTWLWWLGWWALFAQDVTVEAEFEHAFVRVGERTTVKAVVRRPAATVVHIEESNAAFAPFELVKKDAPVSTKAGDRVVETRRYTLTTFSTDSVLVLRIPYTFTGAEGRVRRFAEAQIRFKSVLDGKKTGLKRDFRLAEIPDDDDGKLWALAGVALITVAAATLALWRPAKRWMQKRRRRKAFAAVAAAFDAALAADWSRESGAEIIIVELGAAWKPWLDEKAPAFSLDEMRRYAQKTLDEYREAALNRPSPPEIPDVSAWVELLEIEEAICHARRTPPPQHIRRTLQKARAAMEQRYRFLEKTLYAA